MIALCVNWLRFEALALGSTLSCISEGSAGRGWGAREEGAASVSQLLIVCKANGRQVWVGKRLSLTIPFMELLAFWWLESALQGAFKVSLWADRSVSCTPSAEHAPLGVLSQPRTLRAPSSGSGSCWWRRDPKQETPSVTSGGGLHRHSSPPRPHRVSSVFEAGEYLPWILHVLGLLLLFSC